jgi:flagellar P-ring protein FlgI
MRRLITTFVLGLAIVGAMGSAAAQSVRIKDLGKLQGLRENALVGQGIVTGLAGTGDSPSNQSTRQALSNMLSQFNIGVVPEQIQSRNVAMVMVTAALPALARAGDAIDVSVTSIGDARSLLGGTLLLTALRGPDGKVYALSQGALSVGGFRYDANGNTVQKNHPTVGAIPSGAVVEVGVVSAPSEFDGVLTFLLNEPDYTTADRIAQVINNAIGADTALPRDAAGIEIRVPERDKQRIVNFVARLEALSIQPDRRARVVLNERTGTLVSGGDVRIAPVAVSHGDLRVTISSETSVSQPLSIRSNHSGVRTAVVTNSQLSAVEGQSAAFVDPTHSTVSDLVRTLIRMRTNTRDIISILRAIKAAGALHAELVIQ